MERNVKVNTNPRYRNFTQTYFTAGDEEQFKNGRDYSDSKPLEGVVDVDKYWIGYRDLSGEDVTNTFRYLFHKFKKAIYIRIKDNQLITFLPFSKAKFINEWGDRIKVRDNNIINFLRHVSYLEGRRFNGKYVNTNTSGWYANNCLVRYEFPLSEGDTGTHHVHDMISELCKNRKVPDIELFINRRDFPLLKTDGTEPYNHMWDDDAKPLVSHKYDRYIPILSCVTGEKFADVAIPTTEDWSRVRSFEGVSFPKTSDKWDYDFSTFWEERKPIAVFRGSSTGVGVTIETNPRLKVAFLSSLNEKDQDGLPFLDAGITQWKVRPRKVQGSQFLQTIDHTTFPFKMIDKLSPEEQAKYKYVINIDGHVSAFRLSLEMNMGCCILLVDSEYKMWFSDDIKPYVHYVPVKGDLSDLIEKIKWCKTHDSECKKMAENCRSYYVKNLCKDGILDHLKTTLDELKIIGGNYKYTTSPSLIQYNEQKEWLSKNQTTLRDGPSYGVRVPDIGANYPRFFNKFYALSKVDFKRHLKLVSVICRTKLSCVGHYKYGDFDFTVKTTSDKHKLEENIHEAYIGVNVINHLLKKVPNFNFTFGTTLADDLVSEKINGVSMFDWLSSESFNIPDFKLILIQLALALQVAQMECGFVHYDLFPWNVILETRDRDYIFDYVVEPGKTVEVTTRIIPVIIDYGKSHVVFNGLHYGVINMFTFSSIQDIMSITLSSVNTIFKRHVSGRDEHMLKDLVRFFRPDVNSVYDAKNVAHDCSFSNMISRHKEDIECSPLQFADAISKLEYKPRSDFVLNIGSPRLFFSYDKLKYDAYKVSYTIPDFGGDRLKTLYYFQRLEDSFYECKVSKRLIQKKRDLLLSSEFPNISVPSVLSISINDETFNNKEVVENILENNEEVDYSFLDYYDMIAYLLARVDEDLRNTIKDLYRNVIGIDKSRILCNIASRNTVKNINNLILI